MNEIINGLYVGDMSDGRYHADKMHVLSVMWGKEDGSPEGVHNIETTTWMDFIKADVHKMNEAADWIHDRLSKNEKVLVHCAFGMERSPLTVVWYLMRHKDMNLSDAYLLVKQRRPMVADRRNWLPHRYEEFVKKGLEVKYDAA